MAGIWIMLALTLLVSMGLTWGLFRLMHMPCKRYGWLVVLGLPLSALVNIFVKAPIIKLAANMGGFSPQFSADAPFWFLVFAWLISPFTEELIKVLPLVIPQVKRVGKGTWSGLRVGFALGIGFGLGEAIYLAWQVSVVPDYAALPWYMFTGFLIERVEAIIAHGLMTAVACYGLWKGGLWRVGGLLIAMAMHAFLNAGAMAYQLGWVSVSFATLWTPLGVALDGFIVGWLNSRARREEDLAVG